MNWLERLREEVVGDYVARTPASRALFERARKVLPGGVSGNLRFFAPYPLYMRDGDGCRARDVDGNAYIDCFSCNGPLLLGRRHPAILRALDRVRDHDALTVNPEIMVECAERIIAVVPCAERVRFLNSGTEAVMAAIRYARGHTGKDRIVKFHGHYHGQDDQVLVGLTSAPTTFGAGVPSASVANTLLLPFNDLVAFAALMRTHDDVAAVILDPAMHSGGLWGASPEFLAGVREITKRCGVVLIFDEVITGFRLAPGGAQAHHGVTPDLATFAKALSAGERLGAVAGSAAVMSVTDPLAPAGTPRVFQSGTANDGTFALAAATAAIGEYQRLDAEGAYTRLAARTAAFDASLRSAFERRGMRLQANRLASMMQLFLAPDDVSVESPGDAGGDLLTLFYLALINNGVLLSLPTSNHLYFSFAHDTSAFEEIGNAVEAALGAYPFAKAYQEHFKGA